MSDSPTYGPRRPTIPEIEDEIVDEFEQVDDWMDRYSMIIEEGEALPAYPDALKTPDRLIDGCQSRVWIDASLNHDDGTVALKADSDALIVKGIIALLLKVLDGHTPDEILATNLDFINRIGLQENLSPTRSNGLRAMVKRIRDYALALKHAPRP